MDVNPSTNSVEAERCLELLVNQLTSSQYWQGSIRSNQIKNCVVLFNRYLRLSSQQDINALTQVIRDRVANEVIFDEFISQLNADGIHFNSYWLIYKNKLIRTIEKLLKSRVIVLNLLERLEDRVFNFLPETLKNSIIPAYRRPLILLYLFNMVLFVMRLTIFNSKPIFRIRAKTDYYSRSTYNASNNYYYPTIFEVFHEILMFILNVITSIIPLALPIVTLHFMNGQHAQI
ncbi:hypothetical protein OIY81_1898 [Cryptosporidium canis]|uniref:Uncharacterized protein n=1 Tax=Cryptosporidium canis TaxID=195482 RepID=A0ABQ8P7I3_9CRYT|nr:hypothetical protein OJ252_1876 [Cryptosporidium canis]KAJ1610852.1 hypothetical protein OIY81_1898 [Cryptosporidium canis]